jgi:hypothetical protein
VSEVSPLARFPGCFGTGRAVALLARDSKGRSKAVNMAIRHWHPGQVAVLWIGGLFAEFLFWALSSTFRFRLAMLAFWVTPFVLLAITWRWFGTRPRG